MAGYSKTPLSKKLGYKENYKVLRINPPSNYLELLHPPPMGIDFDKLPVNKRTMDIVYFITKSKDELEQRFDDLIFYININRMIWISWPKKASKVKTDLNVNIVRKIGLSERMVEKKIATIDDIWSGLKFGVRTKDR